MNANALVGRGERHCALYFAAIERAANEGLFTNEDGAPVSPSYPNVLLVCETPTHFAIELLGATPVRPTELRLIHRSLPSLGGVLGQFEVERTQFAKDFGHLDTGGMFESVAFMSISSADQFRLRAYAGLFILQLPARQGALSGPGCQGLGHRSRHCGANRI